MSLGPMEIALIVLVIILLFGAKRLPDAARSIGRSMRIFKSEVKEMNNDPAEKPAEAAPGELPPNRPATNAVPPQQSASASPLSADEQPRER